jgi:hypothetical protein
MRTPRRCLRLCPAPSSESVWAKPVKLTPKDVAAVRVDVDALGSIEREIVEFHGRAMGQLVPKTA